MILAPLDLRSQARHLFFLNLAVPNLAGDARGGRTAGYVYVGATLVGIFSLSDECRTGVTEAIERLKLLNIKTVMLTGDTQEAAIHAQNHVLLHTIYEYEL